jgi:3-hydroxyacyl-CoA dehydrogenase
MKYQIHKAVVIGSGTMGASIAAHLANAGVSVMLLDIPAKEGDKNQIVKDGWDRCLNAKPANLMASELKTLVTLGNLDDDFDAVSQADWVCEAIIENLNIKQDLMARIDEVRKPTAIVSTNTSGIPVHDIAEGRSKEFKKHFLGTHFFNPPRYLKLLEVIPTEDTSEDVVEFMSHFGEYRLGKGIVLCKDTPNFVGNRLGSGTGAFALDFILKNVYTVDEVDAITGPLMGRPKTATFRLLDLVGIDVWDHVGRNLAPLILHDKLPCTLAMISEDEVLAKALLRIAIITTPGARNVSNDTPPGLCDPFWLKASLKTNSISRLETTGANSVCIPTFQNRRVSRRHSVQRPIQFTAP